MLHFRNTTAIPKDSLSPSHKLTYNPAIFSFCQSGFNQHLYMITRCQNSLRKPSQLIVSSLNDTYEVEWSQTLEIDLQGLQVASAEDPRVVVKGQHVYLFFNSGHKPHFNHDLPNDYTIHVACLTLTENKFHIQYIKPLTYKHRQVCEKNWSMFFDCDRNKWMCIYSVNPWIVLEFQESETQWIGTKVYDQDHAISWPWGQIRGGSSPVKTYPKAGTFSRASIDSTYYSFFHSSYVPVAAVGKPRQYVGGLLTFKSDFPYVPTGISRFPIIVPQKGDRSAVQADVVFPGGAVKNGEKWLVSYGVGDRRCRIDELLHDELVSNATFDKGLKTQK